MAAPGTFASLPQLAAVGILPFYAPTKYVSYDAPVRLAWRMCFLLPLSETANTRTSRSPSVPGHRYQSIIGIRA
jgi:hypothetical protein